MQLDLAGKSLYETESFFDKIYKIDVIYIFMDKAFWSFFGSARFEINRQDV